MGKLQISRPKDMVTKQAAAAVGQCELMYTYDKLFAEYSHKMCIRDRCSASPRRAMQ